MSTNKERAKRQVDEPDRGDLELGIHALYGVLETVNWIEHHQLNKSEDEMLGQPGRRWSPRHRPPRFRRAVLLLGRTIDARSRTAR
jgi:hypothetical protein